MFLFATTKITYKRISVMSRKCTMNLNSFITSTSHPAFCIMSWKHKKWNMNYPSITTQKKKKYRVWHDAKTQACIRNIYRKKVLTSLSSWFRGQYFQSPHPLTETRIIKVNKTTFQLCTLFCSQSSKLRKSCLLHRQTSMTNDFPLWSAWSLTSSFNINHTVQTRCNIK